MSADLEELPKRIQSIRTIRSIDVQELSSLLDSLVRVLSVFIVANILSVDHEINVVLLAEVEGRNPRRVRYNFVNVPTMRYTLNTLLLVHHRLALHSMGQFVATNANDQVAIGEEILGLLQ